MRTTITLAALLAIAFPHVSRAQEKEEQNVSAEAQAELQDVLSALRGRVSQLMKERQKLEEDKNAMEKRAILQLKQARFAADLAAQTAELSRIKAMREKVNAQRGREHAYAKAIQLQLETRLADAQAARQDMVSRFSAQHPKVVALSQQITAMREQLAKATSGRQLPSAPQGVPLKHSTKQMRETLKLQEEQIARVQESFKKNQNETLAAYLETLRASRAKLMAQYELAKANRTETQSRETIRKRTNEMLLMQSRLDEAETLRKRAMDQAAKEASRITSSREARDEKDRLGRIEKKLDRIANLLEKLIDQK